MRSKHHLRMMLATGLALTGGFVHDDGPGRTLSQSTKNRSPGSPEKLAAAEAKRARKAAQRLRQLGKKEQP